MTQIKLIPADSIKDMPDFRSALGIAKSGISRCTSLNLDKSIQNDYISTRQNRVLIKVTKLIKNQQFRGKNMAKLKLKPLADRVVIKPMEAEEKTKGGIILPDTAKEKPIEGTIVAVGPGKVAEDGKLIKPEVKEGDKVLYGKYSGTEVTVDGDDYLIMRESDIFAIVG
jgi:chaperonin GroES